MSIHTNKHQYQAYVSATQTVAKTQQIIMLYDGIIRLVQQAKEAIAEKRIEDRYNLLVKASYIVHGLQGCLDFENGKEIADVLYGFYASIDARMFSVHRTNSIETCDAVIHDLKQMRDAWAAVDEATAVAATGSANIPPQTEPQVENTPAAPAAPLNITLSA